MFTSIKEVAALLSMQMAMSKYFPSMEKFYDAVASAEKTTTEVFDSIRKRITDLEDYYLDNDENTLEAKFGLQ
ncbi:MAG: hypothetical protein ABI208_03260 [Ginsengibacter sp.]|jgi:hypothetical protein